MAVNDSAAHEVSSWARMTVGEWPHKYSVEDLEEAARSSPSTYIFRLDGTCLAFDVKPLVGDIPTHAAYAERAKNYYSFFQEALSGRMLGTGVFAINVCDGGPPEDDLPIFGFQRVQGSRRILMPDIELFCENHLTSNALPDVSTYMNKMPSAIFVGSTTGGGLITHQALDHDTIPRIRSARFFRKNEEYCTYLLPNIVHAESADVEMRIRKEGYSGGGLRSWPDQLKHRFVLSADGHGAACSRLRIGLGSNSVLVKYASPHELYYFNGLKKGVHFLEVSRDDDVIDIVRNERREDGYYADVAAQGAVFEQSYLNKELIREYCFGLISLMIDKSH